MVEDRKETLKFLADLNPDTRFQTLGDNYIEQLRAVLNYKPSLSNCLCVGNNQIKTFNGSFLLFKNITENSNFILKAIFNNKQMVNVDYGTGVNENLRFVLSMLNPNTYDVPYSDYQYITELETHKKLPSIDCLVTLFPTVKLGYDNTNLLVNFYIDKSSLQLLQTDFVEELNLKDYLQKFNDGDWVQFLLNFNKFYDLDSLPKPNEIQDESNDRPDNEPNNDIDSAKTYTDYHVTLTFKSYFNNNMSVSLPKETSIYDVFHRLNENDQTTLIHMQEIGKFFLRENENAENQDSLFIPSDSINIKLTSSGGITFTGDTSKYATISHTVIFYPKRDEISKRFYVTINVNVVTTPIRIENRSTTTEINVPVSRDMFVHVPVLGTGNTTSPALTFKDIVNNQLHLDNCILTNFRLDGRELADLFDNSDDDIVFNDNDRGECLDIKEDKVEKKRVLSYSGNYKLFSTNGGVKKYIRTTDGAIAVHNFFEVMNREELTETFILSYDVINKGESTIYTYTNCSGIINLDS